MGNGTGLLLALLGIALGAAPPAGGGNPDEELLELLEFLGDAETASDDWDGFFDSLPERLDDANPTAAGPVAAEEAKP